MKHSFLSSLSFATVYQYLRFVDVIIEMHEMMIHRCVGHQWHPHISVHVIKVTILVNSKCTITKICSSDVNNLPIHNDTLPSVLKSIIHFLFRLRMSMSSRDVKVAKLVCQCFYKNCFRIIMGILKCTFCVL